MSNLDNITNKIKADAQQKADEIIQSYEHEINKVKAEYETKSKDLGESIISKAKVQAENERAKIVSQAKLRARDEKLAAKQATIEKTFDQAKLKLKDISDSDYTNFVNNILNGYQLKDSEEVILQEGKKDLFTESNFKISDSETVESGFIIKDGDIITNYTFDDVVDFYRSELEGEIANILFDGKE